MRFRRRAKIFPGVVLNFSKTGVSTTIGVKGANVNFGKQGAFLNTGLPGTGLYDRKRIGGTPKSRANKNLDARQKSFSSTNPEFEVSSADVDELTCKGLQEFQNLLTECQSERRELRKLIDSARKKLKHFRALSFLLKIFLIGFFLNRLKRTIKEARTDLQVLEEQLSACQVEIDLRLSPDAQTHFEHLHNAFDQLRKCSFIWDVIQDRTTAGMRGVGGAEQAIVTEIVQFDYANIPLIKSDFKALHLQNANGADLFIYPSFILILDHDNDFGILDLRNLKLSMREAQTVEPNVPPDGIVIGETWLHARKDGLPDRRYKDNWQIPVVKYARIDIKSDSGLNEAYQFSSYTAAEEFFTSFTLYQSGLDAIISM